MEPYYQDGWVTLYHGDCLAEHREWLEADVMVTDPPYGMSYTGFGGRGYWDDATEHGPIMGDNDATARDEAIAAWGNGPALIFGTWRIARPQETRQVLIWDKSHNGPGMGALDLPWGPSHEEIYVLGKGFAGKRETSVITATPYNSQSASRPHHPTPKPLGLMQRLLAKCPAGTVADPFAGSGATLVAATMLGIKSVGVEIDERHCEVIANRLSENVFDFGALA